MVYVALLRGINVGGNRKIDMRELKSLFLDLELHDARTYINSGNVIFSTDAGGTGALGTRIERGIEQRFGFPVKVVLRDRARMARMLESLPHGWVNDDQMKCDVMFLSEEIDSPEVLQQLSFRPDLEDVRYADGAVLWRIDRKHVTRSGMLKIVGTPLYAQMTVRNCNTARKLSALMSQDT